jgi:hypothetical protein
MSYCLLEGHVAFPVSVQDAAWAALKTTFLSPRLLLQKRMKFIERDRECLPISFDFFGHG